MHLTGQIGIVHAYEGFGGLLVQWATNSYWCHTVIAVSATHCLSAEPGGATIRPIDYYAGRIVWSDFDLTLRQRVHIIRWARDHVGVEYNWSDFILAGIASLTGRATPNWLRRMVATPDRLICSQLCDLAYQAAGIHLFNDDRPEGAVTPKDFGKLFVTHGWTDRD